VLFRSFAPAISKQALRRIGAEVRSWRLHHRTSQTEADLARWIERPPGCGVIGPVS
jgi:RNA-directed DNA polymerase